MRVCYSGSPFAGSNATKFPPASREEQLSGCRQKTRCATGTSDAWVLVAPHRIGGFVVDRGQERFCSES